LSYWTKLKTFCFAGANIKKWFQNRTIRKINIKYLVKPLLKRLQLALPQRYFNLSVSSMKNYINKKAA